MGRIGGPSNMLNCEKFGPFQMRDEGDCWVWGLCPRLLTGTNTTTTTKHWITRSWHYSKENGPKIIKKTNDRLSKTWCELCSILTDLKGKLSEKRSCYLDAWKLKINVIIMLCHMNACIHSSLGSLILRSN